MRADARRSPAVAALALLAGVSYYLVFRGGSLPPALDVLDVPGITTLAPRLADPSAGTFPSFVHGFALACLLLALPLPVRTCGALLVAHLGLTLGFEAGLGTPDPNDALALLTGTALACALRAREFVHAPASSPAPPVERGTRPGVAVVLGVPLLACSAALTVGSDAGPGESCALYDEDGYCSQYKRPATPVYMDYATLRDAIEVRGPRSLDAIGQLYAFGDTLFVGERQQGVHVIDNSDPAMPVNVGFVRIPGNTEIAIRGRYLYADSYVDLVTLDIADPRDVRVVDRQADIFPWDAYQSVPYDIGFTTTPDPSRGVVVTYDEL